MKETGIGIEIETGIETETITATVITREVIVEVTTTEEAKAEIAIVSLAAKDLHLSPSLLGKKF